LANFPDMPIPIEQPVNPQQPREIQQELSYEIDDVELWTRVEALNEQQSAAYTGGQLGVDGLP